MLERLVDCSVVVHVLAEDMYIREGHGATPIQAFAHMSKSSQAKFVVPAEARNTAVVDGIDRKL